MSLSLTFIVDSAIDQLVDVTATVDGEDITVKVPGVEVHLRSPDDMMFPVFRFRADMDAARAAFAPGSTVTLTVQAETE